MGPNRSSRSSSWCLSFQFMKFVKRIGAGDLTIRDNQVFELKPTTTATAAAAEWSQEFATGDTSAAADSAAAQWSQELLASDTSAAADSAAAQWVGEFQQQTQMPNTAQSSWAHQYLDASLKEVY